MTNFIFVWWVSLCHGESCFTVCLQLCWVLHFLTRYDPRYVTEKSLTNAKSIAWLRLCLELAAFEEFANALLKTVAIRAKIISFMNHVNKTNDARNGPKKSHFNSKSGIDSISRHIPSLLNTSWKFENRIRTQSRTRIPIQGSLIRNQYKPSWDVIIKNQGNELK